MGKYVLVPSHAKGIMNPCKILLVPGVTVAGTRRTENGEEVEVAMGRYNSPLPLYRSPAPFNAKSKASFPPCCVEEVLLIISFFAGVELLGRVVPGF